MDNYKVAKELAEVLSQRKASDVVLIDIAEKSSFADYFTNCTASSERQLGALQESVDEKAYELGLEQKGLEGKSGNSWILVDYGDIIVNIFTAEMRERYALDKIWGDCKIERIED